MQYSPKVLQHFQSPKNNFKMADADGIGKVYNPLDCGDMVKIYLKVSAAVKVTDAKIENISFECVGCPAAIASASAFTEMAKGKTIADVLKITRQDVANVLGGLPENKINCSVISCDAFKKAIKNYEKSKKGSIFRRVFKR